MAFKRNKLFIKSLKKKNCNEFMPLEMYYSLNPNQKWFKNSLLSFLKVGSQYTVCTIRNDLIKVIKLTPLQFKHLISEKH